MRKPCQFLTVSGGSARCSMYKACPASVALPTQDLEGSGEQYPWTDGCGDHYFCQRLCKLGWNHHRQATDHCIAPWLHTVRIRMAPFLGHDGAVNDGEPPFTGAQNKRQLQRKRVRRALNARGWRTHSAPGNQNAPLLPSVPPATIRGNSNTQSGNSNTQSSYWA
jgi:hypothetical protein